MTAKKKSVLIIDDEKDLLKALSVRLEAEGYSVLTASDGLEGLEAARKHSPGLIVLDLMLPKLNGFKVARFLKFDENYKDIPIIMLTARAEDEDKAIGMDCGGNRYITKPFENDVLISAVHQYLG